ncbi:MAG: tetratricopeptide repeat protein [Cyanobacteria bacterium P01_C01_bin.118]
MKLLFSTLGHLLLSVVLSAPLSITMSQIGGIALAQESLEELEDFDYWQNLCRLQTDAAKYDEALTSCEQAIELEPKDARIWAAHSGILLNLEQYPEAIASAERSLNFDAQNSLALTYQCIAYTALDQNEIALDVCNDALRLDGDWGDRSPALAWRYRGNILDQAEQHEQALVAYDRTLLLESDDSQTLAYKCRTEVNLERYSPAIETCQQALDGNLRWGPESEGFALYYQGIAYTNLALYDRAIAAFDLSLEADPENAGTWTYQGLVLQNREHYAEALTSYTRAVELAPTSARALVGQCTVMNQLQAYETAADACQQAIQGDGEWWELGAAQAWNQRGHALAGQGMYEPALAAANRAVGMRPDYAQAWSDRSVIFWYLGTLQETNLDDQAALTTYEQAILSAREALDLDDTNARTWANLGRYHRSVAQLNFKYDNPTQGNDFLKQAVTSYKNALKLDPQDDETWVNYSVVLWLMQDYDQALRAAQRAVDLNISSTTAWQTQGAVLTALGQYEGAQASYFEALRRDETSADAWASYGVVTLKLNEFDEGIQALQMALQLDPEQPLAIETLTLVEEQLTNINPPPK